MAEAVEVLLHRQPDEGFSSGCMCGGRGQPRGLVMGCAVAGLASDIAFLPGLDELMSINSAAAEFKCGMNDTYQAIVIFPAWILSD